MAFQASGPSVLFVFPMSASSSILTPVAFISDGLNVVGSIIKSIEVKLLVSLDGPFITELLGKLSVSQFTISCLGLSSLIAILPVIVESVSSFVKCMRLISA